MDRRDGDRRRRRLMGLGGGFTNLQSVFFPGNDEYSNIDAVQTALAATTVGTWLIWYKPVLAIPGGFEVIISFSDTNANTSLAMLVRSDGILQFLCVNGATIQWDLRTTAVPFVNDTWCLLGITQPDGGGDPFLTANSIVVPQSFSTDTDKTHWFSDMAGIDNGRISDRSFNSGGEALHANNNSDEILFINRALTVPQHADVYNGGTPKDESGIANGVSYFRIDGDTVPTMVDFIGSNNGTYVNTIQSEIQNDVP